MKYNPKINEKVARIPGFAESHPLQDEDQVQGSLEIIYSLQEELKEITGMDEVTLQPAAGAHGEWTALMIFKAYHQKMVKAIEMKLLFLILLMVQILLLHHLLDLNLSL